MARSYPIEMTNEQGKDDTTFYQGNCTLWYIKNGLWEHDGCQFLLTDTLKNYHSPELIDEYHVELMNDINLLEYTIERVADRSWLLSYIEENY